MYNSRTSLPAAVVLILTVIFPANALAAGMPDPSTDKTHFESWQVEIREKLRDMLGIPVERAELAAESRGQFEHDGIIVEKWLLTSETGSRMPAVVYRPKTVEGRLPAVVLTFGHGGSKSQPAYNYTGQLFAKMNILCLAIDPIGEEERHIRGKMGTRAHDPQAVHMAAWNAGRPIMGKLVFDTMRGVDYLLTRADVDAKRIGVSGNSLGGAKAGWMAALDPRLRCAIVSGWAFAPATEIRGKFCTRLPNQHARRLLDWHEYLSLAAPHCSLLVANGDADTIIDDGSGQAWRDTDTAVAKTEKVYIALGNAGGISCWYEPGGGHRPYPTHPEVLAWLVKKLRPPGWTAAKARGLPRINFGRWCDDAGVKLETLYGTKLHLRGATVADMKIRYLDRKRLAVLRPEEIGGEEFTIEGWLRHVTELAKDEKPVSASPTGGKKGSVLGLLKPWMKPQTWRRDTDGPVLSLGETGRFDDTHIFAPTVMYDADRYSLWYCGSRGQVRERIFRLGLATSPNGRDFTRHECSPVLEFGDGKHSIITPTILRTTDGTALRENGKMRMWFSSRWFSGSELHKLHDSTSTDGIRWEKPSPVLLEDVYAPSVLKDGDKYHLWYSDTSRFPWVVRHATSDDGRKWLKTRQPAVVVDQPWESKTLFYPMVIKADGVYLMWYGSYWSDRPNTTAIGFAVSLDGVVWHKNPHNPVLQPDPKRPWESNYVTSQSVIRLRDGSFRIWYASRKKPPFLNKYFAIGTAVWEVSKEK